MNNSDIICSESINLDSHVQSIELTPHLEKLYGISSDLQKIEAQKQHIKQQFEQFKEKVLQILNHSMGKITSLLYRQLQNKAKLEEMYSNQLYRNKKMEAEVVQLQQMISQFIKNQSEEVENKDREIVALKQIIQNLNHKYQLPEENPSIPQDSAANDTDRTQSNKGLQIIQEVTQYTSSIPMTPSASTIKKSFPFIESERQKQQGEPKYDFEYSSYPCSSDKKSQTQGSNRKVKKYINFFRQQVDENTEGLHLIQSQTLREKDTINLPSSIKSPRKMEFAKKSSLFKRPSSEEDKQNSLSASQHRTIMTPHSVKRHQRIKSSSLQRQRQRQQSQPYYLKHSKSATKQRKKSHDPNEQQKNKSYTRNSSKQKIKLTTKIFDEENHCFPIKFSKKPLKLRPSVHLGGKAHMKKLAKEVRMSLQDLKIWEGEKCKEVRYDGDKKNGMRWGRGRLFFDNGFEYQGEFVQNYRHGYGKICADKIEIYEGNWSLNELSGEGYIRSLKNMSQQCPRLLYEASFCGQLLQNKFHGMGTLFINQNEKFVSKFIHGVPVGEYTYYNHSDIEFGNWL